MSVYLVNDHKPALGVLMQVSLPSLKAGVSAVEAGGNACLSWGKSRVTGGRHRLGYPSTLVNPPSMVSRAPVV